MSQKIFVAMSGGVDSSVTAALLQSEGFSVEGITMRFSLTHPYSQKVFSWGDAGVVKAKIVAGILGIPHHVVDLSSQMNQFVIQYFTQEYVNGRTPNPCVFCNRYVKFDALWGKARALGAERLATGHYVRLVKKDEDWVIQQSLDERKDQSYFLWAVPKDVLPFLMFPLGGMVKSDVKKLSEKFGLPSHQQKESQDICFITDGYQKFLEEQLGPNAVAPGDFVNAEGKIVGRHKGILNYTVGQRENLGIALGHRAYVYKIDAATNTVYVGKHESGYAQGLTAKSVNLFVPPKKLQTLARGNRITCCIRHGAPHILCQIQMLEDARANVVFAQPQLFVTPGQSVVFYEGDCALGGGIIG